MTRLINNLATSEASIRQSSSRHARDAVSSRPVAPAPCTPAIRTIRIALLGCGNVGGETARCILSSRRAFEIRFGIRLELVKALVRDVSRRRLIDQPLITESVDDLWRSKPDVVIEALGGIPAALEHVTAALQRGIPVVTANKSLIARFGTQLTDLAQRHKTAIYCEAAVAAAVPVLAALTQLAGDRVRSIRAILNGTCNFILTRMSEDRVTLNDAVKQAIARGLAEPDPTADLAGIDSAEKLCVLAAALGIPGVTPDQVETRGLGHITVADLMAARSHGYAVKLVAELRIDDDGVSLRVGPTLMPRTHGLARTRDEDNAFVIDCNLAGAVTLHGRGAGSQPTASAILGDVLRAARDNAGPIQAFGTNASTPTRIVTTAPTSHFVRLAAPKDQLAPQRVLAILDAHGIATDQVEFQRDAVVLIAAESDPTAIAKACAAINSSASPPFVAPIMD